MRSQSSLLALAIFLLVRTISATILLEQFGQVLVGFPAACCAAYNAPITGCNPSDFTGVSTCSQTCIAALNAVTNTINAACAGSKADPNSLIGLFFQGKATSALCPTASGGNSMGTTTTDGGVGSVVGTSTMTASSLTTVDTSIAHDTSTASTNPVGQTASTDTLMTTRSTNSLPTTSPSPSSASTTTTTSTSTTTTATETSSSEHSTIIPSSTTTSTTTSTTSSTLQTPSSFTSSPSNGKSGSPSNSKSNSQNGNTASQPFTSTAVENGSATVITSLPDRTGSSNADSFGGGGSPFEIASGSTRASRFSTATCLLIITGALSALLAVPYI